ncbi:MAG TPA: hypothetical protein VK118_08575 [Tetragenococcus sp.]|nr:hypothetical protein [Tetragenococcus sp.]
MLRQKSKKQQWLENLQYRYQLKANEAEKLSRLNKGFQGEVKLDLKVKKFIFVNDLGNKQILVPLI